jgi:hypothetical protein
MIKVLGIKIVDRIKEAGPDPGEEDDVLDQLSIIWPKNNAFKKILVVPYHIALKFVLS